MHMRGEAMLLLAVDGGEPEMVLLAELLADNSEDGDLCAACESLEVGESASFGGGAAPFVTVERVS